MDEHVDRAVRQLFSRYQAVTTQALRGVTDGDEIASLYAAEMIAASPQGVRGVRNDAQMHEAMTQAHARWREIGTREMRILDLHLTAVDAAHVIARARWRATYARDDLPQTVIVFDVHYLVQVLDGTARVFGWITGDEEAVLRQHGVI